MRNTRKCTGLASGLLVGGTLVAAAAAPSFAAPTAETNAVSSSAGSTETVASATSFIHIGNSGEVVLVGQNGQEYELDSCHAHLTADGASFDGCTGSGPADFFSGQTPTAATLTGVPRDGQAHAGQLTLTTTAGTTFNVVVETVNFPVAAAGTGCVFIPDSTTAAFSCNGGQQVR